MTNKFTLLSDTIGVDLATVIANMEQLKISLKSEMAKFAADRQQLEAEKAQLKAAQSQLQDANSQLKNDKQKLEAEQRQSKTEIQGLKDKVRDLETRPIRTTSHMIPATMLEIVWGNTPEYWIWKALPESIYTVAELVNVCWLEFVGKVDTSLLVPNRNYGAYLVFKLADKHIGIASPPAETFIGIAGGEKSSRNVTVVNEGQGPHPTRRQDEWMEAELGEYYVRGNDGELEIRYTQYSAPHWKSGLIVQGIEVRAK